MFVDSLSRFAVNSTVLIETSGEKGAGVGTGFAFQYERTGDIFLVTNKHVLEGAEEVTLTFVRKAPDGSPFVGRPVEVVIEDLDFESLWFPHSELDICVAPFQEIDALIRTQSKHQAYIWAVPPELLPESSHFGNEVVVGNEVLFFGYPDGLFDSFNIRPLVRRGILSTSLELDFDDEPCLLIDAAVYPGSSGSPVFAVLGGARLSGNPVVFIGVVSHWYPRRSIGKPAAKPIPSSWEGDDANSGDLNLGMVIKAHKVSETIQNYYGSEKVVNIAKSGHQIKWKPTRDAVTVDQIRKLYDLEFLAEDLSESLRHLFNPMVESQQESSLLIRLVGKEKDVEDTKVDVVIKKEASQIVFEIKTDSQKALSESRDLIYGYCSNYGGLIVDGPIITSASKQK